MRARLALLVLALGACPEVQPDDPLDPATIAAVAEAEGDAEGSGYSGAFFLSSARLECDCPQTGVDACESLPGLAGLYDVTHVDGYLTLVPLGGLVTFGMSGAAWRDGSFELAAISGIDSLVSMGSVYARLDGRFAADGSFTGDLAYRLRGEITGQQLDCRAAFEVHGAPNATR